MTIIASMSFSNLHPHVKLGILLVFAAVLLDVGNSRAFWALIAPDRLVLSASEYGWLSTAWGLAGLFVVAVVIWVDSRPLHGVMAAGALVLAIGFTLLMTSDRVGLAAVAAFIAGAGGAAVGSLIFNAVAAKGFTRFKGVLIGVISLVWTMRWDAGVSNTWGAGWPIGWYAFSSVLAIGTLLFVFLPHWFAGSDRSGQTFRETVAFPGAKVLIFWVAAVYLVGAMIMAGGTTHLRYIALAMTPGDTALGFGYQVTALVGGIGAFLWGMSADFFPVRRLLIVLAVLSLPAVGCSWLPGGQAAGALLLWLVLGGLISLPWVLMAETFPDNHFGKLALCVTWVGLLGSVLGPIYWGWGFNVWNTGGFFWMVVAEMVVLVVVVACRPRVPRTGI